MSLPDGAGSFAIRGAALRATGYVIGVLVSLGAATVLVRHLGISEFGRYTTIVSLVGLVGGIAEAGIQVYGIRTYAERANDMRGPFMATLLGMRLSLSAAGVILAACFGLAVGYRSILVVGTLVVGAGLLVQVAADVLSIALQAELQLGRLALVDFVRRSLALVLTVIFSLAGAGLLPFFFVIPLAAIGALVLLQLFARQLAQLRVSFQPENWRSLFGDSLAYAVAMSVGAVYFYVTIVLMSLISSGKQTGYFATSFRVVQVALGIPILLLTAIFPLISREAMQAPTGVTTLATRVLEVAVMCGLWMTLTTALAARFIVHVIAGRQGSPAIVVLELHSIILTLSFISTSSALALISLRKYKQMIATSTLALLVNVGLVLLLVPPLGARGGAISDVISEASVAVILTAFLLRGARGRSPQPGRFARLLLAAMMTSPMFFLGLPSVARAIAATLIYFGVLLAARAIPPDLLAAAKSTRSIVHRPSSRLR